jgi:hypothetical protein
MQTCAHDDIVTYFVSSWDLSCKKMHDSHDRVMILMLVLVARSCLDPKPISDWL